MILAAGELGKTIGAASAKLRADLLVIGRSQTGNEIARVRSLAFMLAHEAPCPVVVV